MRPDRRGFVLPTTLMVMTLLTVLLSAAFVLISAEFRATDNTLASQRALAIAQGGIQNYLSRNNNLSGTYDSVASIPFSGGYATVAASRLIPGSTGKASVWVVRSYGYATDNRLTGTVAARRVVAALASLNPGVLYTRAALVSMNQVMVQGSGAMNLISGTDEPACAAPRDTFGLSVAAGDYVESPPGAAPSGGINYVASRSALYDSTHVDWAALLSGDFTPDYDVTSGSWPAAPSGWPVYYSSGDAYLTNALGVRSGVLVVRGNVRFGFFSHFKGVIIAGGTVTNDIFVAPFGVWFAMEGSIISGLNNAITANSVGTSYLNRPIFTLSPFDGIRWASCYAASSAAAMGFLSPIPNTWTDNWSLY